MSAKRLAVVAGCLLVVVGCADTPTGIQLRFAAEPALNTEAQVVSFINRIEVMVARSGGFDTAGNDTWQSIDVDGDSAKELVLSRALDEQERRFPLYRLLAGGQPQDTEVEIWARGLLGAEVAAVGERASAMFRSGRNQETTLKLNLRSRYRAPRVLLTLPHAGQDSVPSALGRIYLEFSKWIETETVPGNLVVIYSGTEGERELKVGDFQLTFNSIKEHGLQEERTSATLDLGECSLSPGSYRIEARAGITDQSGQPLDQYADKSGANDFVATFSVEGSPKADPCASKVTCNNDDDCNSQTGEKHYVCVKTDPDGSGSCIPLPASCNDVNCPAGWVCSYADGTYASGSENLGQPGDGNGQCLPDCRLTDNNYTCPAGTQCNSNTGLCISSSTDNTCSTPDCAEQCLDGDCDPNWVSCLSTGNPCPSGSGCDVKTGSCVWCTVQQGCCSVADANEADHSTTEAYCDATTSYCDPYTGACVLFLGGSGGNR